MKKENKKKRVNWFRALCCLLFWIILGKVFINICLTISQIIVTL